MNVQATAPAILPAVPTAAKFRLKKKLRRPLDIPFNPDELRSGNDLLCLAWGKDTHYLTPEGYARLKDALFASNVKQGLIRIVKLIGKLRLELETDVEPRVLTDSQKRDAGYAELRPNQS